MDFKDLKRQKESTYITSFKEFELCNTKPPPHKSSKTNQLLNPKIIMEL